MAIKDEELLKKLRATFKVEAEEHLQELSAGLLALEKSPDVEKRQSLLETVFREAHSLKGAARSVNLAKVESFCQKLESVFAALQEKTIELSPGLFDLLHRSLETLDTLVDNSVDESGAKAAEPPLADLKKALDAAARGDRPPAGKKGTKKVDEGGKRPSGGADAGEKTEEETEEKPTRSRPEPPAPPEPKALRAETVRLSADKLKAILLQSEEMLSAKVMAVEQARNLREMTPAFKAWKKDWSRIAPLLRRHRARKGREERPEQAGELLSDLDKLHEFLERNRAFVKSVEEKFAAESKTADLNARSLGEMVNTLLDDMKQVMTVPFSSLLAIFPKYVRDLAHDRGKEIDLQIRGGEIEIDRRILEEMKDPLMHLVRNSVDHGIEKPDERQAKGKQRCGTISLTVAPRSGGKVEIVAADDGGGIDTDRVREAAGKIGLQTHNGGEELSDEEAMGAVFRSGISTSPIITEISGRGLGLAIVQEKAEKVGGTVALESRPHVGTTFRLVLPMTIATFRGILVQVDEQPFILPTNHVHRVVRMPAEEVGTVENCEAIELDGQSVALARLRDVLELPGRPAAAAKSETVQAVVLTSATQMVGFAVDSVLSEQEVLLKNLGTQLVRVRNISGATVLGSGTVVPILNVGDLMKSALAVPATGRSGPGEENEEEGQKKSILVAEDSITSRTFLKNILESAGYEVSTAVDGADALAKLHEGEYHVLVSDVDMPRLNGFELTEKVRADRKYGELPVVLVTALESKKHRERGIDVGANAYIVKSSFDHGNLLEVVGRLV